MKYWEKNTASGLFNRIINNSLCGFIKGDADCKYPHYSGVFSLSGKYAVDADPGQYYWHCFSCNELSWVTKSPRLKHFAYSNTSNPVEVY
jgi:hypothetical protein